MKRVKRKCAISFHLFSDWFHPVSVSFHASSLVLADLVSGSFQFRFSPMALVSRFTPIPMKRETKRFYRVGVAAFP